MVDEAARLRGHKTGAPVLEAGPVTPDPHHGKSFPIGSTVYPDGVNFSVYSGACDFLELLLFDHMNDGQPSRTIRLDPEVNRTYNYWHIFVPGLKNGQLYGYRAYGPFNPEKGLRFDPGKILLDPYTRSVASAILFDRKAAMRPGDNSASALKSVVVDRRAYNWEGDAPLNRQFSETAIYELHVAGFTRHPASGVSPEKRGTYAGLIEKIPYLLDLGVTAVELMPVQEFDEGDAPPGLTNYWGYSPIAFFAPHSGYCSCSDPLGPVNEFRDMVKALHRAGIEVILDVVFNHTAEGDDTGPTLSFRGLDNEIYYILQKEKARYANYSGCGNTINSNNSVARRMILECLRYWVEEMHVDGFRFDLASVMSRDEWGEPLKSPPILWEIETDPVLAGTKIIAEAWDAAGLYQVGSFIGHRWAEWNGQFRDDVRRFLNGHDDAARRFSYRMMGSPDLYTKSRRDPSLSINFVTCHDGFTMNDLVSYDTKHNEANLQENRDGFDDNLSWNCGAEGPTDDPAVEDLRNRQIRNFLVALFFSHGTPMLLMGDEVMRTQGGNNNPYCQDNETSWMDWALVDKNRGLFRFVKGLIRLTGNLDILKKKHFWSDMQTGRKSLITWHGVRPGQPDWSEVSHSIAFMLADDESESYTYVIFNAYREDLEFHLPVIPKGKAWKKIIDTSLPSPDDFVEPGAAPPLAEPSLTVRSRSSVVLMA